MGGIEWVDEETFKLGGADFKIAPAEVFVERGGLEMGDADFLVAKPQTLVERYVELVDELRPERIIELGIFQGGSTALLLELAQPKRLVAVDRLRMRKRLVEKHAAQRGMEGIVRTYGEVDQADRARLGEIVDQEFGDHQLDLVIDDCSHLYEPSRASFNELFHRLRPGGVYVFEDWPWVPAPEDPASEEGSPGGDGVALMRLLFEAIVAIPYLSRSVEQIRIEREAAFITRGPAEIDPSRFDIATDLDFCGSDLGGAGDE